MSPAKARKLGIYGVRGVGKSSIVVQYCENHFADNYYPTIENTFNKVIKYRNQEYACEIVDTAGQDEYSILNSKHAIGIHGYILVYSITSKQSLDLCRVIRDKILNSTGTDWVPIVLVGNKCDLNSQRQVTFEDASNLAKEWNCVVVEASAKQNLNVGKVFEVCLGEVEKSEGTETPKRSSGGCLIF